MYFCLSPPALHSSSVASAMCSPVAHARKSFGEALSSVCTNEKSEMSTRWPLWAPVVLADPPVACEAPQLYDSTSIHSLCLSSLLSPGTVENLKNASNGMPGLLANHECRALLLWRRQVGHQSERDVQLVE